MEYNPKEKYRVLKGDVSVKEPVTNNRTIHTQGELVPLDHLSSMEIKFLVEVKGVVVKDSDFRSGKPAVNRQREIQLAHEKEQEEEEIAKKKRHEELAAYKKQAAQKQAKLDKKESK